MEKYVLTVNIALVSPEFRNAFAPMLVTDDGMVMDVKPVAPWNAFAPILLNPVIVRFRTYDRLLSFTIVVVNCPLPLNTYDGKYTFIPDLPYNVLFGPFVILRPSNSVVVSNVALAIPDPWKAFSPMLVTDDEMITDVTPDASWNAFASMLL